jgi:hypothetical protein
MFDAVTGQRAAREASRLRPKQGSAPPSYAPPTAIPEIIGELIKDFDDQRAEFLVSYSTFSRRHGSHLTPVIFRNSPMTDSEVWVGGVRYLPAANTGATGAIAESSDTPHTPAESEWPHAHRIDRSPCHGADQRPIRSIRASFLCRPGSFSDFHSFSLLSEPRRI